MLHVAAFAGITEALGWHAAVAALLYFWAGLLGGWFFVLPVVEYIAGPKSGVASAILCGLVIGWMGATGSMPHLLPADEPACHDRQGMYRC